MTRSEEAEPLVRCGAALGEGPLWCPDRGALLWLDVDARVLFTLEWADASAVRRQVLPVRVSCVARTGDRTRLVAAAGAEIGTLTLDGVFRPGRRVEDPGRARLNDGKCDPRGRLWVGSAGVPRGRTSGRLHRIGGGRADVVADGLGMSNGLAWSADGCRFFHVDTLAGTIWSWSFDAGTGVVRDRRPFARIEPREGLFDGLTADAEGGLWVAVWGAGQVRRYDATGRLDRVVVVPAAEVSSVAFAGPGLDVLCITSAGGPGGAPPPRRADLSGALFAYRPGIHGVPVARFAGGLCGPTTEGQWP